MKPILASLCLLTLAATTHGREPIYIPSAPSDVLFQQDNYSPQPPPAPGIVPTPALDYQPMPSPAVGPSPGHVVEYPPNAYPQHPPAMLPMPIDQIEPGHIICDACSVPPVPMFRAVTVRQARNIHPCAVRKIVSVPDPCDKCRCVFVEICVPPCACEDIRCGLLGRRTRFDYGKYSVTVIARRNRLIVDYND